MNILSIDYGKKNIGLAWAQTGLDVVLPFGVVKGNSEKEKADKLLALIKKEKIDKIISGLPLNLKGEENENTERVRNFIKLLTKKTKIEVEFIDERFSTKESIAMGGEASNDEKSAMLILQTYLDQNRS